MKKITLLIAFMLSVITMGYGQTVLIPPGDGSFSNGTTFAANGWTVSNSANNPWYIGSVASTGAMAGNVAYVSSTTGTTHVYNTSAPCVNYFYRDVTVPAGETVINLGLNWYGNGESIWDLWQVFVAPVTTVPVAAAAHPGSGSTNVPAALTSGVYVGGGNLQPLLQASVYHLPSSLAGTTFRLIFSWKSDSGGGTQPPAALDNISLVSSVPSNVVSIATGNWSSGSTWNAGRAPSPLDLSVTVAAGHTVTNDIVAPTVPIATVAGTLNFGPFATSITFNNNLTVNAGGAINVYNGIVGKSLFVSGNIVNNGAIDLSVGATTEGSLTLNGSAVQTVNGSGTFTNNMVRNLIFSNTNTAIPNINWSINNVSVDYNLTITNAKINLGTNKLTFGTSASSLGNTFSFTNGGFMPGGKFGRWYASNGTGYTSSAPTSIPTTSAGRYPFYTADGAQRVMYIGRTTPTVGGVYAVTYNNAVGSTTGLSIVDGAYTVTDRTNSNFVVTTEGTAPAEASTWATLFIPDAYVPSTNNSRVVKQSAAMSGTNVATYASSVAQRSGVSQADLLTATGLYVGVNATDLAFNAIANGNWNSPSTWNKGTVPTCTDIVGIPNGYTVTINTAANVARNVLVGAGGSLVISSGDLTVGCTAFNNNFTNNGTFTITGGTLTVNGNMLHSAGSTFNQSGGAIIVDGNDNGAAATSVASATGAIVQLSSNLINWTGGTLTIVDPHASTSSNALSYNNGVANVDVTAGHTLRLGDGVSTNPGGTETYGFRINTFGGSFRMTLFNVIVDGGAGVNRATTNTWAHGINGTLTITANSQFRDTNGLTISGNIVNNGSFIETSTLTFGRYLSGVASPATVAQTVSGTGTFGNSTTPASVTAGLSSLTVNNTAGITLSTPLSVSGTLTLTSGKVNTSSTSVLTLGTATAAGTLSGGGASSYISGPFARTIPTGNTATNFIAFPVGKAAYAPVSVAPVTTTVAVIKAEAFDTNTGTFDASLLALATNRRWEVPVVSGTVTSLNVRLADTNLVATNIPVQAPTAAGVYTSTFGSTATFVAGSPNSITNNTALPIASYTGFLSYAKSNQCSGVPAPGNTISSANNICYGNTVALSVQNSIPGSGLTYQWQSSTNGTTFTDVTGATSTTYTASPTVVTSYRLKIVCATGPDTGFSTPVQINFASSVSNPVGATRCGIGNVTLSATPSTGSTVKWYDDATSSVVVGSGTNFTTAITADKTFYASAQTSALGSILLGNSTATTTSFDAGVTPYSSGWESSRIQYLVKGSELSALGLVAGNITSLTFDVTSAGTFTQEAYTVKIASTSAAATSTSGFLTGAFTTVYGPVSRTAPTAGANTLAFTAPFVWDGGSNIVIEICHQNDTSADTCASCYGSSSTVRTTTTSFNSVFGRYADNAIVCGVDSSSQNSTTSYTTRPNMTFAGTVGCNSPRIAVAAAITPAPAFTLSAADRAICVGATSTAVTIATGAADYTTYTWTPSTGVSGNATTGWVFNPTVTTTYTLQASNATCNANPATVVVNVTLLPTAIALADATYCEGTGSVALTPFGGTNDTVILTENFNGATNNWTTANNSVGGTVANAAWTLKADGSVYTTDTFHSNDNSQFYLSNSAFQAGTTTETILTSPAFNTNNYETVTVSFYHHLKETSAGSSRAVIEFSINGTDWIESNAYESTTGTPGVFVLGTAAIPQTMMNKPAVYVRFKYNGNNRFFWAIDNVRITGNRHPGYTWSPVTGLYTNAAGTTPYVAGTVLTTVYAKPTATTTYTITATNPTGCVTTGTASVSISSTPAPTVPSPTLNICAAGTVANLVATGTGIKWYTVATGGNSLFITTPLVNGTYYATQTVGNCESAQRTPLVVNITTVSAPTVPQPTQTFCSSGVVSGLTVTGTDVKWYAAATGGTALDGTTALVDGTTYYASQSQGTCESTARTAVTVSITVNNSPVIDQTTQTFCNTGTVADLTATGTDVKWYTDATGGVALDASASLASGIYYASQTIDGCESAARSAKTVVVNLVAAPTGDQEQEFCSSATLAQLTATGTGIKWYADATGETVLAADTVLADDSIYYASQTIDGCEGLTRLAVTVQIYNTVADAPGNVTECNEYILPELENGAYYTQQNGGGTAVAAGTAVNQTTTFYVFAEEGNDISCTAQNSFTVTITFVPAPAGDTTQTLNGGVAEDVTIEDIVVTQLIGGTVTWYATPEDAEDGINPIAAGTVLEQGATYYATQTVGACTSATALAVTVDVVLGKEDFDIKAFTYHPNPVTDILNISYSSEITSVTVFNLLGQQIISRQPNATEVKIDMSGLADAAYIINVTAGNTVKTIKVIKKQ